MLEWGTGLDTWEAILGTFGKRGWLEGIGEVYCEDKEEIEI